MARGKSSVKESGTLVPLIVYFPEMYKHLVPVGAGKTVDRLVSFVDFPATMLNLDETIHRAKYRDGYDKEVFMEDGKVYKGEL